MAVMKKTRDSKGMVKREPLCTVAANINWCSHYGKQCGSSSESLNTELPCDTAIPLLGIDLKKIKTLTQTDACTPVFITVLFTIAKAQQQPMCLPMDTHTGVLFGHKK